MILHGKNCSDFGLQMPSSNLPENTSDSFVMAFEQAKAKVLMKKLNIEQRHVFEEILASCDNDDLPHRCYFLDGPGSVEKIICTKLC